MAEEGGSSHLRTLLHPSDDGAVLGQRSRLFHVWGRRFWQRKNCLKGRNRAIMGIMNLTKLAINIDESFQYLPRASIVEAVIDIQARPGVILEEATLKLQLESRLSGYQFLNSMKNLQIQHEVNLQGGASVSRNYPRVGLKRIALSIRRQETHHTIQSRRICF